MESVRLGSAGAWKIALGCALLMLGGLGCPHAFGRKGTIDRAAHKDTVEGVRWLQEGECPPPEDIEEFCEEQENTEECLRRCRK